MKFKVSHKLYIHVDCDSFFASCEVLRYPEFKDKYVCVWGDIIVAATYNAKYLWVKTWMPVWEAKKILWDHAVFLSPDIGYYNKISQQLMKVLREETAGIEIFSIDEAFCDITWVAEYHKQSHKEFLLFLQKKILKQVGIPVSIWMSNTRIKAKIFSKLNKPYGITFFKDTEAEKEIFKKLPLAIIPFIGKSYQKKFEYRAISVLDFLNIWFWDLKKQIGKNATTLWLELMWVDVYIVKKSTQTKSISRTRSFNQELSTDKQFLREKLRRNFERAFEEMSSKNLETSHISIMFRNKDFICEYETYKIAKYTNSHTEISDIIHKLFEKLYSENRICRSTGIFFQNLRSYLPKQRSIFESKLRNSEQNYELSKTIEHINQKNNLHMVTFGTTLLWEGDQTVQKLRE